MVLLEKGKMVGHDDGAICRLLGAHSNEARGGEL